MIEPTGIVVVTHGSFGKAMLHTAQKMFGLQGRCTALALEEGMGREDLAADIGAALHQWGPSMIFVDMIGGTPWNAALLHGLPQGSEVISGISLPLLLEALSMRNGLSPLELGKALLERAPSTVVCASRLLEEKAG